MKRVLCFRVAAHDAERDRMIAELYSLGTLGIEERADGLLAYFEAPVPEAHLRALEGCGVQVRGPEPVPVHDWSRAWRAGLQPRQVSGLWLRCSFHPPCGEPELVIDPEQAFGSGEHASTRLALRLLLETLREGDDLLDVGSGTGVLGLAALRCGAGAAFGLDIDTEACRAAVRNRLRNGLRLHVARARPEALAPDAQFALVVANLLLAELLPSLADLAAHAGRALVLSGFLSPQMATLEAGMGKLGWELQRRLSEAQGGDEWCAGQWSQGSALQNSRSASRVCSNR
ncbi:MAG: 50S ribosomal protein L11 methyltransferase [Myxococcota bacterium]